MFFFEQERKGPQMISIWAAEHVGLKSTRARLGSLLSSSAGRLEAGSSSAGRFDAGAGAAAAAAAARPSSASAADASGGLGFGAGGRRFSRTTLHNLSGSSLVKWGCTNRAVRAWSGATALDVPLSMRNE